MATFRETQTPDADTPWSGEGLAPGARAVMWALPGLLLAVAAPYLIPGAERFQAWSPGDDLPFSAHFRTDGAGPQVAEAGGSSAAEVDAGARAALEATAALGDEPPSAPAPMIAVAPAPAPPTPTDAASPEAPGVPDAADTTPTAPPQPTLPPIVVPPETWEGVETLIEDPSGAMAPFYAALARTVRQEGPGVTRIAHWGDSAIGADGMTSVTRRLLQRQFGDSGHGFILVEPGTDWYKHKDVGYSSKGWKARKIIDKALRDGRYGFGGVAARGYQGARAHFGTVGEGPVGRAVGRFDIYYLAGPRRGVLTTTVDDDEPELLSTEAEDTADAVHSIRVPDGPHELALRVKGGGPVRLYGVALEREVPGVVYDSLGLVGARGSRLLNADPDHWRRQLELRQPDLMILMYGGNELVDRGMNMKKYKERFRDLVKRFRTSRPEAACLIMSPLDHGERRGRKIVTDPMLLEMMPVQRAVALEEGCAWYSVFDAMGGEGAMGRWFRSEPRLGWGDLAHPTKHGARVLGDRFYRALMKGFADHVSGAPKGL